MRDTGQRGTTRDRYEGQHLERGTSPLSTRYLSLVMSLVTTDNAGHAGHLTRTCGGVYAPTLHRSFKGGTVV